jgi:hypothetical protein
MELLWSYYGVTMELLWSNPLGAKPICIIGSQVVDIYGRAFVNSLLRCLLLRQSN